MAGEILFDDMQFSMAVDRLEREVYLMGVAGNSAPEGIGSSPAQEAFRSRCERIRSLVATYETALRADVAAYRRLGQGLIEADEKAAGTLAEAMGGGAL